MENTNSVRTMAEFLDKGNFNNTADMLIEFAEMHVKAALLAASENAKLRIIPQSEPTYFEKELKACDSDNIFNSLLVEVEKSFILNAYPSENIK